MAPLKSFSINLGDDVVSIHGQILLDFWILSKMLVLSSKFCKLLSIFLFLSLFLTCSFLIIPKVIMHNFFFFSHIFLTVLFHIIQVIALVFSFAVFFFFFSSLMLSHIISFSFFFFLLLFSYLLNHQDQFNFFLLLFSFFQFFFS